MLVLPRAVKIQMRRDFRQNSLLLEGLQGLREGFSNKIFHKATLECAQFLLQCSAYVCLSSVVSEL